MMLKRSPLVSTCRFSGSGGKVERIIGVDLSQGMLSQARSKADSTGLTAQSLDLIQMDVEKLEVCVY